MKRHDFHVLRRARFTVNEVAVQVGVGRGTVKRILKQPPIAKRAWPGRGLGA